MTVFVLDNSVTMRWLLMCEKTSDQNYANSVLESLADADALVPSLWHLEVANLLLSAEQRDEISSGESEGFMCQLENLSIEVDSTTSLRAFNRTIGLGRAYKLCSYDAAYQELAIREGLPLATLDKDLTKAARKAKPIQSAST